MCSSVISSSNKIVDIIGESLSKLIDSLSKNG